MQRRNPLYPNARRPQAIALATTRRPVAPVWLWASLAAALIYAGLSVAPH